MIGNRIEMQLRELYKHKVVRDFLLKAGDALMKVNGTKPTSLFKKGSPLPNEHQYYLIEVGRRTGNLISWCSQLDYSVLYISNYAATGSMKKSGINRYEHLAYHIENYLIRVNSVYDRVMQLVDAVFHLQNDPSNCRHEVIVNNLKVKRTDIPQSIKPLRKHLEKYRQERNVIIHHESYDDDTLRHLGLYTILTEQNADIGFSFKSNIPLLKKQAASDVVKCKKREYTEFNLKLASILSNTLDKLEQQYIKEEKHLREYRDDVCTTIPPFHPPDRPENTTPAMLGHGTKNGN